MRILSVLQALSRNILLYERLKLYFQYSTLPDTTPLKYRGLPDVLSNITGLKGITEYHYLPVYAELSITSLAAAIAQNANLLQKMNIAILKLQNKATLVEQPRKLC